MKSFKAWLFEVMTSLLVPCHSLTPSLMKMMLSPMFITEFMSWVLMTVVMLYSTVMSWIRSSMRSEVFGSSPEFGSSQKRYWGLSAMARAMAARFIIPPLISDGKRSPASARFTRSRQNSARLRRSAEEALENMSRGNMTFSSTVILSKRAEPWNNMPISRRSCFSSCLFIARKLRPS